MRNTLKIVTPLLHLALCIFLIIFLSACGEGIYSSSETGSIAFSVEWQGAHNESSGLSQAIDCGSSGVSTVEAKVYDENDSLLASGGPWNCGAHSGTITSVSAGSNRKIVIIGKGSSGNILYWGEKTGITVTAGVTNDAGVITAASFLPTNVTASAGDEKVTISWNSVSGATSYNIYWATSSGVTKSIGTKITNVSSPYTHTGLTNATTYYYVVTAENNYGESGESSEVNATPEAGANTSPQLSSGYVSPESGTTVDTFIFYVDYEDADEDNPATKYVYINGMAYAMEFYSGSFSNGTYYYQTTLGEGTYSFYFEFTDGNGGTSRLPATGSYSGPEVNTAVVTVTGKILNNGQPVTSLLMHIYDSTNHPDQTLIDESYTDNEGVFSFSFIYDREVTWYRVMLGEFYYSENVFVEWTNDNISFESDQIALPDFDIHYTELFSPPDGATYNANEISDSNPIVFEWTNGGRSDIISYYFEIFSEPIWTESTDSTTISFNGILDDETKITTGTYTWRWWCYFGAGWWGNSGFKTLIIE